MKQNYTFNKPSIDSLKLSFKIGDVKIINQSLLDHKIKQTYNTVTGEVEDETPIQQNSLKHQYEEYQIHFAINNFFGVETLVVLLNSKLLEYNYMNGISIENIELIYNKIMEAKIFDITFLKFLSLGMVSDIDIKNDYNHFKTLLEFSDATLYLKQSTTAHKEKNKGVNRIDKETNKGLEWNSRATATFTAPFTKIYHKGIESVNGRNALFFKKYVNLEAIKNVVRLETTIKNFSTHGAKLNLIDNSLLSLLKLKETDLEAILINAIKCNLNRRIKRTKPKTTTEYKPTDMINYKSLVYAINKGEDIDNFITYLIEDMSTVAKSRTKKKLKEIYESEIEGSIYVEKSKSQNDFFNSIGWN